MEDKILLDLIESFLLKLDNGELFDYILKNKIKEEDMKKLSLCLSKSFDFWNSINCNRFKVVIQNIDNINFIDNEDNYLWRKVKRWFYEKNNNTM